jgi:hypothetical protein
MMQMQPGSPGLDHGNQGQENVLMISPNKQSMSSVVRWIDVPICCMPHHISHFIVFLSARHWPDKPKNPWLTLAGRERES